MAVLVSGGAGYIGSHMVLELLDRGQTPVVVDNLSTGFRWAVPEGVAFHQGDVADGALIDRIAAAHGIDAIIHFAAKIVVPDSVADPLGYYLANTVTARSLIESAVRNRIRHFISSSTAAASGDVSGDPVKEDDPLNPVSPYGRSKLMSEWMLRDLSAATPLRHVALRYFNVAGCDRAGRIGQSTEKAALLVKGAARALEIADKLARMKVQAEGNIETRNNILRQSRTMQIESALRLGNFEEALEVSRDQVTNPRFNRRMDALDLATATARGKLRYGQALLGAGKRADALVALRDAEDFYREQQAKGASDTGFRLDFARTLYHLARAQAQDAAGRTARLALLDEAMTLLGGLTIEAQQLRDSKELIKWVTDARSEARLGE